VDSRLTVILVSTAANWRTLESRRARENLSLSTKHPGGILVSISNSRVTHWTTWLHSRVFSAEGQKWREPPPRTTAAFVRLRTLSTVAILALVSSRYHYHFPLPTTTIATDTVRRSATSDYRYLSSSSSFPPAHIDSSLFHELAAFRQAPRACDDSLHSDCTALRRFQPLPSVHFDRL